MTEPAQRDPEPIESTRPIPRENGRPGPAPDGEIPALDLEQLLEKAIVVDLPLTVRFRGVTRREAVLLPGPRGWGEFAPFLEYDDAEAAAWWRACLEAAYLGFPAPLRSEIPVNATVPAVAPERVPAVLGGYGEDIVAVKVKVAERGQGVEEDEARVAAVRAALPEARIRVDANQGWTVDQAVSALRRLSRYDLEYAEQPAPGVDGLYAVREALHRDGVTVPIAADESVRKAEDPLAVARAGAADLIVVKVAPLGGVRRALSVVEQAGLPAVVSSALDTSVGLSAGVALAASLPELPYACGLGTGALLARDVTEAPLKPEHGKLPVRDYGPGSLEVRGLVVDDARRTWWLDRVRRVHALLEPGPGSGPEPGQQPLEWR
ncbi:O-succinylbenzoate synthase [Kocuria coralli]|uniref:o-succinylbenzoate synthase n=1 Tax=Kocuria coralli TaxID=1461025 RepID=A0A5J5KZY4_9MICC|nr:o-succinylbenzoate synthase [Kocuria coralli]KAA9395277.1 O-succinylbenzoate synthase [Kocuria coralli]